MAQVIEMPKLSDTMEDGGISEWLRKEGELIEEGEPLVAIETDKATIEYASPLDGHLLKILVEAGKRVALKEAIAVFGEKGESFKLEDLQKSSEAQTSQEPTKKEEVKKEEIQAQKTPLPSQERQDRQDAELLRSDRRPPDRLGSMPKRRIGVC